MRKRTKRILGICLCLSIIAGLCLGVFAAKNKAMEEQTNNLQKLCKVWGFAKYTHQAFIAGQKDWDAELLALIPVVQSADKDDVNDILYDWFTGLGDSGYALNRSAYEAFLLDAFQDNPECCAKITNFFDDANHRNLSSFQELNEKLLPIIDQEVNMRQMADLSWMNEEYLGQSLAAALLEFQGIQTADRSKGPVFFDSYGCCVFTNEKSYDDMDFSDSSYRLLGLFRLWNVIEYYFPYIDLMEDDWNALLPGSIAEMMKGSDRLSYQLTLAALASKLHDGHVSFLDELGDDLFSSQYGGHVAPVTLSEVEGRIVVVVDYGVTSLEPGDIVLRINGADAEDIAADMLQYISSPTEDKALLDLLNYDNILRQKSGTAPMKIDVLRDGAELQLSVSTAPFRHRWRSAPESHTILDQNIGLINPALLGGGDLCEIMNDLADTDGLIVDLRQYPTSQINYDLAEYLLRDRQQFSTLSGPLQSAPGVFVDIFQGFSGPSSESHADAYFYEKNVVLLMNIQTISAGEFAVMSLRNGENVTVMGSNSRGADGDGVGLPLPGAMTMGFTGLGVYTPVGGQTQCIGLSPDIYVEPTIAGVREGRDELMEAAIKYLISLK